MFHLFKKKPPHFTSSHNMWPLVQKLRDEYDKAGMDVIATKVCGTKEGFTVLRSYLRNGEYTDAPYTK